MKCSHKCFCYGPVFQHTPEILPLCVLIQYVGPRSIPNGNSSTNSRCIIMYHHCILLLIFDPQAIPPFWRKFTKVPWSHCRQARQLRSLSALKLSHLMMTAELPKKQMWCSIAVDSDRVPFRKNLRSIPNPNVAASRENRGKLFTLKLKHTFRKQILHPQNFT